MTKEKFLELCEDQYDFASQEGRKPEGVVVGAFYHDENGLQGVLTSISGLISRPILLEHSYSIIEEFNKAFPK